MFKEKKNIYITNNSDFWIYKWFFSFKYKIFLISPFLLVNKIYYHKIDIYNDIITIYYKSQTVDNFNEQSHLPNASTYRAKFRNSAKFWVPGGIPRIAVEAKVKSIWLAYCRSVTYVARFIRPRILSISFAKINRSTAMLTDQFAALVYL